jgi:hypothetical protein
MIMQDAQLRAQFATAALPLPCPFVGCAHAFATEEPLRAHVVLHADRLYNQNHVVRGVVCCRSQFAHNPGTRC